MLSSPDAGVRVVRLLHRGRGERRRGVSFSRFLEGTALENRASLERDLAQTQDAIHLILERRRELANEARRSPGADAVTSQVEEVELQIGKLREEINAETASASELREFVNQLETQSARLTRAVVAGGLLHDFDFVVCPRCGNAVSSHRGTDEVCYLCTQEIQEEDRREDLLREQDRLRSQVEETQELIASHEDRAEALGERLHVAVERRAELGAALDELLEGFVSDRASAISDASRELAEVRSREERLREYLEILRRLADTQGRIRELQQQREELVEALERAQQLDAVSVQRLEHLQEVFAELVEEFGIPLFPGEPRAGIDSLSFKPIVNGRPFDELSAGVRVLVNVAYALAHHLTAIELGLSLPGLLMIDGIHKNIGADDYDAALTDRVWSKLIEVSETLGDQLQVIVAANDVPQRLDTYVRLNLSPTNRLIPEEDLA